MEFLSKSFLFLGTETRNKRMLFLNDKRKKEINNKRFKRLYLLKIQIKQCLLSYNKTKEISSKKVGIWNENIHAHFLIVIYLVSQYVEN